MKRLILLIGPTCTGKSTLEAALNERGVPSVVSYTTRTSRTGEIDGVHYHFLTREAVDDLDAAGHIVQRVNFAGNYYGSTKSAFDKAFAESDLAVIVVEPTGLTQFQAYAARTGEFEVVSVYIDNSLITLINRLVGRFKMDNNGDPAYYWRRLTDLLDQHHEWPSYTDAWTHYLTEMDDEGSKHTTRSAAEFIMDTYGR